MAVNIKSILFKHLLYDTSNRLAKGMRVQIQFYNVNTKSWLALTGPLTVNNGRLNYTLNIPFRISTKNQTIRVVREILKSGGTPSFRIVNSNASPITLSISRVPEVIATTFNAVVEGTSKITIDFNTSWLLDSKKRINKGSYIVMASHVSMFEFTQTIESLSDERESLRTQLAEKQRQIDTMEPARVGDTNFQVLYTDLQQRVSVITRDKENLERDLSRITSDKQNLEKDIARITSDKEELQQNFSQITIEKQNLERDFSRLSTDKENLEREVNDLRVVTSNFEQEREVFSTSISQLQEYLQQEKELVKIRDSELQNKQQLFDTLQQENTKLRQDLAEAQDYTATAHPNKLSANKVYSSIVRDVIKADEELANSKYKLSNISLNLKTTVEKGPEGTVFGLLDFESAKEVNSAAISDIKLDIVPSAATPTQIRQTMPDVVGLTETAVRKIIQNYGLRLDAIYHPTDDKNIIAGQSFKQSPLKEAEIEEGQEVIVIFAKPIN